MGVAPLQFLPGDSAAALGLGGRELFAVSGLASFYEAPFQPGACVTVRAVAEDGRAKEFEARLRLDTPQEAEYYRHGGILPFVLRQLLEPAKTGQTPG
jgi:aconitate hydratase